MIGFALTEEQLATLLKMVFIANIVANSPNTGVEHRKEFHEIEEYVFERAKNYFPMAVNEQKIGNNKHHLPSMVFESDPDVNNILDKYEEYILPFVLAEKFAEREMITEFGLNAKDKMSEEQYSEVITDKATKYEEILKKYGTTALSIDPKYL